MILSADDRPSVKKAIVDYMKAMRNLKVTRDFHTYLYFTLALNRVN